MVQLWPLIHNPSCRQACCRQTWLGCRSSQDRAPGAPADSAHRSGGRPLDQPAVPACALLSGLFPSPRMPRSPLTLRIMLVDLFSHHTMKWHGPVTPVWADRPVCSRGSLPGRGARCVDMRASRCVPVRCPFHSTKEPYRLVHCAYQERIGRKIQAPLSQNMPRNSPTRCADTVTSAHGRADSLRISSLWVQRRVPRRDREGVYGEPRGHSYANPA